MLDKRFDKLPTLMRQAMEILKELHGAPEEMTLPVVLGVANSAVQQHYNVDSRKYGERPISLYFLAMSGTGTRKSTIHREVATELIAFGEERKPLVTQEKMRYQAELAVYNKRKKKYDEDIIKANDVDSDDYVVALGVKPPKEPKLPERYNYIIKKSTLNGILETLKYQSYAWLASTEGGEFFNGHMFKDKNSSAATEMTTALTCIWEGDSLDKNTGIEQVAMKGRRMNMLFMLQKETIEDVLKNRVFQQQGFTNRLLITQAKPYENPLWIATPEAEQREAELRENLSSFNNRIRELVRKPTYIKEGAWDPFELDLETITIDDDAHQILVELSNQNRNGNPLIENYAGFAERVHEHGIRIAATLAAFDKRKVVNLDDALCAFDLMEYFIEQRSQLDIGGADRDPDHTYNVEQLTAFFKKKNFSGTENELRRFGPSWFRKFAPDQRDKILEDMVRNGDIHIEETVSSKGRSVLRYVNGPAIE